MDKITENLYVGDVDDGEHTSDPSNDTHIDVVLNLSRHFNGSYINRDNYIHIPLPDTVNASEKDFNRAVDITLNELEKNNNVLVHCISGISRSVTVAATVLAIHEDKNYGEAVDQVMDARDNVQGPLKTLRDYGENRVKRSQ